jgi:phosphohistidine phosphatase
MNIYIIRHAIAVEKGTPGYDDSQRPLTDAGRTKMRKIVKGLREFKIEFDLIVTSPDVRACDTAILLAKEFNLKDVALSDNLIPSGNFENLIDEICEKYDLANLTLVGHEPMLSSPISWLAAGNTEMRVTLKKAGVAYLSTDNL